MTLYRKSFTFTGTLVSAIRDVISLSSSIVMLLHIILKFDT